MTAAMSSTDPATINLELIRANQEKHGDRAGQFRNVFIGVLSAKLSPKLWAEAIDIAEEAMAKL